MNSFTATTLTVLAVLTSAGVTTTGLTAQTTQTVEERLKKLETEHKALLEEVQKKQFGEFAGALGKGKAGMGPAASKVYGKDEGVSIGGYGEYLYEQRSGNTDRFDALRAIVYVGYRFDQNWVFNSEIEFEHATTDTSSGTSSSPGEVSVEFSYLEYLHSDALNFRGGLLLVPMGFINEMHEPTTYLAAGRPMTERVIVPSTWRETGVGVHGVFGTVGYKLNVISSLNGEKFDASGLRDGRQNGNRSAADDFAFVGRVDWNCCPDFTVGASLFAGDTGQDGVDASSNSIPALRTTIVEAHAEYTGHGFAIRGLYAGALLDETATFNMNTGANLAKRLEGYYVEVGYDVLKALGHDSGAALLPFVRWEQVDTQASMASGFTADPTKDETILTFGLHYRPISQIVIKADFQKYDKADDVFQLGFGYVF